MVRRVGAKRQKRGGKARCGSMLTTPAFKKEYSKVCSLESGPGESSIDWPVMKLNNDQNVFLKKEEENI